MNIVSWEPGSFSASQEFPRVIKDINYITVVTDPFPEPDESSQLLCAYFFKNQFKLSAVRPHIPRVLLRWLPDQNFLRNFHVFISCCTFLTPLFSFYKGPAEVPFLDTVFLKVNCTENSSCFHLISHISNKAILNTCNYVCTGLKFYTVHKEMKNLNIFSYVQNLMSCNKWQRIFLDHHATSHIFPIVYRSSTVWW
jgi:hypothetical protein